MCGHPSLPALSASARLPSPSFSLFVDFKPVSPKTARQTTPQTQGLTGCSTSNSTNTMPAVLSLCLMALAGLGQVATANPVNQ
jgi:hypothetical protein